MHMASTRPDYERGVKMKRLISLLMAVAIALSMTTTVSFAYEQTKAVDEAIMYNSAGEELKFTMEMADTNQYKINFYVEDELIRVYEFSPGNDISVTDLSTNQTETIEKLEAVRTFETVETSNIMEPADILVERWTDLGYIHFRKSSQLGAETCAAITAHSTDFYKDTYAIETDESRRVDAMVTLCAGVLIESKMPVPVGGWLGVAQLLVEAAIAAVGAEVIGDIVSMPFKEYFDCTVTEYELAGQVVGKGNGILGEKCYLTGKKYSVEYQEDSYNDEYEGFTPETWKTTTFAREIWNGSMPDVSFPGYIAFPAYYPL